MAYTDENFTGSQSLSDTRQVTLTDTHTGTDASITSRRVTFTLPNGTTLVQSGTTTSYEVWPIADASKTFTILSRSSALSIKVDWLNVSNTIVYTKTIAFEFPNDDDLFLYEKFQEIAIQPSIVNDVDYYNSLLMFTVNLVGSEKAIEKASNTASAQNLLDRNFYMIQNETRFF